ncbi:MAG: hypothetical protein K9M44_03140 [Candidatus Pacebacteria bacterium]|nr:hypothetical protein [Candidatus Paceibacterota bacterium]
MFETSGDILNLVIAICVLAFTVFLVWTIYYFLSSLKRVHKIVAEIEKGVKSAIDGVETIKDKIQKSSSYVYLAGEAAKTIIDLIKKDKKDKDFDFEEKSERKDKKRK